jgi:hypothetical protein
MSNSDKLTIIAGKRRFKAVKELGWKQIPVIVLLEDATETDIKIIQVTENLQRKELKDVEAGFAVLTSFESAGFIDHNEIIKGVKSIDNWFVQHANHKANWDSFIYNSVVNKKEEKRKREETSELRYDEKFVNICKSISLSPKYQYQLLQVVLQLDPDVLVDAQKIGLSTKKKMLLTHSKLRKHPQLQKDLIKDIATKTDKEAEYKVRQIRVLIICITQLCN